MCAQRGQHTAEAGSGKMSASCIHCTPREPDGRLGGLHRHSAGGAQLRQLARAEAACGCRQSCAGGYACSWSAARGPAALGILSCRCVSSAKQMMKRDRMQTESVACCCSCTCMSACKVYLAQMASGSSAQARLVLVSTHDAVSSW